MQGYSAITDDQVAMKRIVTTLLALAGLGERALGLPRPVLCFVIWILGLAEAVARQFVNELHRDFGTPKPRPDCALQPPLLIGAGASDALCLTNSLRILALALCELSAPLRRTPRPADTIRIALEAEVAGAIPSGPFTPCHREQRNDAAYVDTS